MATEAIEKLEKLINSVELKDESKRAELQEAFNTVKQSIMRARQILDKHNSRNAGGYPSIMSRFSENDDR